MDRFSKALLLLPSDRVRCSSHDCSGDGEARTFGRRGAANRTVAQMEVEARDAEPPTGGQYLAIAGVLQQLHEYALAETYLDRAKDAGAPHYRSSYLLWLARYLAMGETRTSAAELALVKQTEDSEVDYQYLLAAACAVPAGASQHRSALFLRRCSLQRG